jgi:predicted GIY-YIG superfamily endonuclease
MKTCKLCNIEKSLTEFNTRQNKINGSIYYEPYCKPCRIKKVAKHRKDNWDNYLQQSKKYYYKRKLDYWVVYLIPSINYVGKTNFPERRMATHRSESNIDTTGWKILHTNLTESEALKIEKEYHTNGYTGFKNWKK